MTKWRADASQCSSANKQPANLPSAYFCQPSCRLPDYHTQITNVLTQAKVNYRLQIKKIPMNRSHYLPKPSERSLPRSASPKPPFLSFSQRPALPCLFLDCNCGASVSSVPEILGLLDELYQLNSRMSDSGSSMSVQNLEEGRREQSSEKKNSNYVPGQRSGKWTDLEHMKYIVFIDFNKERMRSKEKRRSNNFYQEMANFIVTRNALQCRSHHQKLEEKYNHAPKIVNVFKPSFDRAAYRQALDALHSLRRDSSSEKSMREASVESGCRHVETQTEIGGLHLQMVMVNHEYVMIQPRGFQCLPHMHPAFYYHPFFQAQYQQELGSPSLPTSELLQPQGWENRALSFDFGQN